MGGRGGGARAAQHRAGAWLGSLGVWLLGEVLHGIPDFGVSHQIVVPSDSLGFTAAGPTTAFSATAGQSLFLPDLQNNTGAELTVTVDLFVLKIA